MVTCFFKILKYFFNVRHEYRTKHLSATGIPSLLVGDTLSSAGTAWKNIVPTWVNLAAKLAKRLQNLVMREFIERKIVRYKLVLSEKQFITS